MPPISPRSTATREATNTATRRSSFGARFQPRGSDLLSDSIQRLSGNGGNPVIKLQTNFGGGKTHSMIALYHLFSGAKVTKLAGIEPIMERAGVTSIPTASRAVLVGIALGPGRATVKKDGTEVRTFWGEMAYQLLGKKGFAIVADADKHGVSPGSDALRELFQKAAPCLILIDEWIAYVRQLYGKDDMPAGSFDANLTFAQALTEAARAVPQTQVVATIPISPRVSDQYKEQIEIGGEAGREALVRLEQVFARMESPWRAATGEESFEIVRRRLFEPIKDHAAKDAVVRRFSELYKEYAQDFPSECKETDYRRRMEMAYPIHPELFDRLYQDWSSLERFQLTRGVLRLLAAVINSLWMRNDGSAMILPCMVPLDDSNVRSELTRYLQGQWDAIIERDIDGPQSLPLAIDGPNPSFRKYSACRRVARTVFIGSAPTLAAANRGIEDRKIKLGCIQPGETPAVFGDALRHLTDQATHLYLDKSRYWYSLQPSVTRLAQDRAQQIKLDDVHQEIIRRLRLQLSNRSSRGDFIRVHICPDNSGGVPDEMEACLVVLGPEYPHVIKQDDSAAVKYAHVILESRGTIPRSYKNALVFLAADRKGLDSLEQATTQYLAWRSIADNMADEELDLDNFQRAQVKKKLADSDETIEQRIPEAYQWALFPEQKEKQPDAPITWLSTRIPGDEPPAVKVSRKLTKDGQLAKVLGGITLRLELDRVPLWPPDVDHVRVKLLSEYFAKYTYLPRLQSPETLLEAIRDGLANLSWSIETFAYATCYDETQGRYLGLKAGSPGIVTGDADEVLVKPAAALRQIEEDKKKAETAAGLTAGGGTTRAGGDGGSDTGSGGQTGTKPDEPKPKVVRRFYGVARLDPTRVGRDAGTIANEVLQHLTSLVGAKVDVSIEIRAEIPEGVSDQIRRTVTENCRTLRFDQHEFEEE